MPPTVPINHYLGPRNQQNRTDVLFHYSMLMYTSRRACFEHSNFFKVNVPSPAHAQSRARAALERKPRATSDAPLGGPDARRRNPTTSFLTATTLIYAIGAGITAAAGTRLALQSFLVKGFRLFSFQLQDLRRPCIVIYCHYLPVSGLGNLRACCLPWMW